MSDEFADSATPSKVKQAYLAKRQTSNTQMEELLALAKKLNVQIVVPGVQSSIPDINRPQPQPPKVVEPTKPGNKMIDGKMADTRQVGVGNVGSVTAFGSTISGTGAEYAIKSESKASEDLKEGEVAEIGRVKGRGGVDIAIPVRRVGKSGETRVAIIDTGGDPSLQKRFKELVRQSESPNGPPDFIRGGYQTRTIGCPLCRQTGWVMGGSKECPKCGGGVRVRRTLPD